MLRMTSPFSITSCGDQPMINDVPLHVLLGAGQDSVQVVKTNALGPRAVRAIQAAKGGTILRNAEEG
jgi:hypothetical protein